MNMFKRTFKEQDKWSDIEQQLPFGDCKYSNTLLRKRGDTKPTGTSYHLDKVSMRKVHNILICTYIFVWYMLLQLRTAFHINWFCFVFWLKNVIRKCVALFNGLITLFGIPLVVTYLVSTLVCRGPWISTVVLFCWCHSDSTSILLYFTFLSHLFPLPCGSGSTVPREVFDSSVIMPFSWCVVAVTLPI